jgi:transcriptional regulator with XRE-family HTH domain
VQSQTLVLTQTERLYLWRRKMNLSQQELAEKLKVHQTTVSKMEKGTIPVSDRVAAIIEDVVMHDGDRVAVLRRRSGLTLEQMSRDHEGLNAHRLSEIERGFRACPPELLSSYS